MAASGTSLAIIGITMRSAAVNALKSDELMCINYKEIDKKKDGLALANTGYLSMAASIHFFIASRKN